MSDTDPEAALERLEAALDRIAAHAQASPQAAPALTTVATRLDRLIGQLRDALSDDPAMSGA